MWVFVSLNYVMIHLCGQSMCKTKPNMVLKFQGLAKEQKKTIIVVNIVFVAFTWYVGIRLWKKKIFNIFLSFQILIL
jgi:hypothetical protein